MPDAPVQTAPGHFADCLADAIARTGSPACVGLDPVLEKLPIAVRASASNPAAAVELFCQDVLRAVARGGGVAAVKFQSACFERYGGPGVSALARLTHEARDLGFVVVLDAKRGDIGVTAEHYAAACFGGSRGAEAAGSAADALTVSPYLGPDTIEPFLTPAWASRGLFVLVRTSNPGSDAVQTARLADGRTVAEMMADLVADLGRTRTGRSGLSSVGAVVGATKSTEAAALRKRMPDQVFLVPGYGAQGGTLDDIRPMLRDEQDPAAAGVLVAASRSVIYAARPDDPDWSGAVRDASRTFADELRALFR